MTKTIATSNVHALRHCEERSDAAIQKPRARMLDCFAALAMTVVLFGAASASAQTLRVGVAAEPTSLDPQFHNLATNAQVSWHIFDPLVMRDDKQQLRPGLAESWRVIDPTTWEIKLRKGVKFHDGSDFTVEDVFATFHRAPLVPRSPSSFAAYVRGKTFEKVDDHNFLVKTPVPAPLTLNDFTTLPIISRNAREASTEDFNARRATNGTGPFRVTDYVSGDRVELTRNDAYWGQKSPWEKVTLKVIRSEPSRVAALLSGDVDVIDAVPTTDVARLKTAPGVGLFQTTGSRVIYLRMEHFRDTAPFTSAKDGSPIKNPFKDQRVRLAMAKAINRQAIVDRVMDGAAVPAGQFVPDFIFGASPKLKPLAFDLPGARKLLADAGLPNGFKMTIHGPNGRYVNDTKVIEAIAQMWNRAGIETAVETLPPGPFFSRAARGPDGWPEFGMVLTGWGSSTGEGSDPVRNIITSFDDKAGFGAANRARYSNEKVDALLKEAIATIDDTKRAGLIAQAVEVGIGEDVSIIPVHFQMNIWAARKGITVTPRVDEYTLVMGMKP
ncbi:MAG: ABC transporter substrate-binding protein [Bosea sp. (in: a-proteobacteria)]